MDASSDRIGKFIVIEGLDGAGTTTEAKKLYKWLQGLGQLVFLTREPSDGPIGLQIRMALSSRFKVDNTTLALLFAADRLDHIFAVPSKGNPYGGVRHFLKQGYHVISDRYDLSSYAYQALSCDLNWIQKINSQIPRPDLTIFLDVPVTHCMWRIQQQRGLNYQLFESADQLERVRANYLHAIEILLARGEHIEVLDGTKRIIDIKKSIETLVGTFLMEEDIKNLVEQLGPGLEIVRDVKSNYHVQITIKNPAMEEIVHVNFYPTTGKLVVQGKNSHLEEKVLSILNTIRPNEAFDSLDDLADRLL